MQANRGFWKAVHGLSHPVSVVAILLLQFNDHYLRHHYPSWLSGKLGDFTWLVFAPFIAAMLFSLLLPQKPRLLGVASVAFIGIWFALFKTVPFVMALTKDVLSFLVGWRGSLGMDASDLLCLPALGISWTIWKNAPETSQYLRPVIYVAFALGIMGTLATSYAPPPEYINTICQMSDGSLQVNSGRWESIDGGLSWISPEQVSQTSVAVRCSDVNRPSTRNFENNTLYRWIRAERVEYSTDDGASWRLLRDLPELRQDARLLLNHSSSRVFAPEYPFYQASPVSGIVHTETGNLVLAMSTDGVLVIARDGESSWVAVGYNELADLSDWETNQKILNFYFPVLISLAFLIFVTTIVLIHQAMKSLLVLGWLSWLTMLLLSNLPLQSINGFLFWGLMGSISLFLLALPLTLWATYHLVRHYESAIVGITITAILACLANFFPLFLWSQGTISRYYVAVLFSIFLTAAVLAASYSYFRPKLPSRFIGEKTKRKNDTA
jgi:hypothetical protein